MQPITEEQEWTLRRWAHAMGRRPRKRDKAFLQADKGLTEEQIDTWWRGIDGNRELSCFELDGFLLILSCR
jgi:hypothetical protein